MLIRNITDRFPIPHEPDQFMILRKLTGKQLRRCKEQVGDHALDKMRRMGGEVFKAVSEITDEKLEQAKAAASTDRLAGYDLDSVLKFGIANWSYAENGTAVPVNDDTIAALDTKTERWAAETTLEFSGAFETPVDRKND